MTESHSLGDIRKQAKATFPFSSLSRKQVVTTGGHGDYRDYRLQFEMECGVVAEDLGGSGAFK